MHVVVTLLLAAGVLQVAGAIEWAYERGLSKVTDKRRALYEPVHGSAPDIAGKGMANPIAMIGSLAMCLRYSFGLGEVADRIEAAIAEVLAEGLRTADIKGDAKDTISTPAMGDAILARLG